MLASIKDRLIRILLLDTHEMARGRRALLHLLRLTTYLGREFSHDQCPTQAAALSYTTVFYLIPLSVLAVLYFKVAGTLETLSGNLQERVARVFIPEAAQDVVSLLDRFVSQIDVGTLGVFGVLGLFIVTYFLFRTIERAVNDIWKLRVHRSILTRLKILSEALVVIPLLVFGSLYVSGKVQSLKFLGDYEEISSLLRAFHLLVPYLLTLSAFFVLFKLLPNTRVRWQGAAIAALVCALFFEWTKAGFNFYILNVVRYHKVYGALGLIPITLLWIYLCWLIALAGVEISFTLQNVRSLHEAFLTEKTDHPFSVPVHEEWGLAIVRTIAGSDVPATLERLANGVPLPRVHLSDHLGLLVRAKILERSEIDGETAYTLSRIATDAEIRNVFRRQLQLRECEDESRS